MPPLFSPFVLGRHKTLKNRLAVAPMTTQQSHPDGSLSPAEADWLGRLSEDGFGMVITCAASISDTATAFHRQLSLAHDAFVPALSGLAAEMKRHGSLNIVQLCHGGARALEELTGEKPHSASSYELPLGPGKSVRPVALTHEQMAHIARDFARACERAERAGFDGIELHGANGYLFTQFISRMSNHRTDAYGGSLENRARFCREVVRACRQSVSEGFIVGFRLSFEGMGPETGLDIDENIQIANGLAEDGIDYIHSSQMGYAENSAKYPAISKIEYLRKHLATSLPLIVPGSIGSVEDAEKALSMGADIVAVGRLAIGNIHIPQRFARREPLAHTTPFPENHLREMGISEAFLDYVKNSPNLKALNILPS